MQAHGQEIHLGAVEGAQQAACVVVAGHVLAQRLGHRGLGAVGDHLHRIDEMLALGTQALEAFLFGQFFQGDMALRGLALSFQRGDFFLQLVMCSWSSALRRSRNSSISATTPGRQITF